MSLQLPAAPTMLLAINTVLRIYTSDESSPIRAGRFDYAHPERRTKPIRLIDYRAWTERLIFLVGCFNTFFFLNVSLIIIFVFHPFFIGENVAFSVILCNIATGTA